MKKRLLLAIQFWEGDKNSAMDLVKFICDLEPKHSDIADLLFVSRFDCPHSRATIEYASKKFNAYQWRCPRHGIGWPDGCNELWFGTMEWVYHMVKDKKVPHYDAVFTFEADGCPLTKTWISDLVQQWESANAPTPLFVGGNYIPPPQEHINGNSLYSCNLGFLEWLKKIGSVPPRRSWDTFLAPNFKAWGWANLQGIVSEYQVKNLTEHDFSRLISCGRVWHHGCKDDSLKKVAREKLLNLSKGTPVKLLQKVISVADPLSDLTVCITSFKRAGYLKRAIDSCKKAGIRNISVFSMQPDAEINAMCRGLDYHSLPVDLGCNELWLQAAYRSRTDRMIILHDDDFFHPDLGKEYVANIRPALEAGAGFASWRAHCFKDDGTVIPTEYMPGPSRLTSTKEIEAFNASTGHLSLSPVVSILDRRTVIQAAKESAEFLPFLHPGMTLGTEVLVYLRHCSNFNKWFFHDKVLSYYGTHDGSGTVAAQNSKDLKPLCDGYDVARKHYLRHKVRPPFELPARFLLCHCPFNTEDQETKTRINNARKTWDFQFNLGDMLDFPVTHPDVSRSSLELEDKREIFYLRDVIDYGISRSMPEDVIIYANSDIAFTIDITSRIAAVLKKSGGVCVGWRRNIKFNPDQFFSTVRNGSADGGVDLIAVTPAWWSKHRETVPDMFVSSTYWDFVFRVYAEQATRGACYMDDGIYHYPHTSLQSKLGLRTAAQRHNHSEAKRFFNSRGMVREAKFLE